MLMLGENINIIKNKAGILLQASKEIYLEQIQIKLG
jgi:hypothetical protein